MAKKTICIYIFDKYLAIIIFSLSLSLIIGCSTFKNFSKTYNFTEITQENLIPFTQIEPRIVLIPSPLREDINGYILHNFEKNNSGYGYSSQLYRMASIEGVEMIEGVVVDLYGGISIDFINLFGLTYKDWKIKFKYGSFEMKNGILTKKKLFMLFLVKEYKYPFGQYGFSPDFFLNTKDNKNKILSNDRKNFSYDIYDYIKIEGDTAAFKNGSMFSNKKKNDKSIFTYKKVSKNKYIIDGEYYRKNFFAPTYMKIEDGILYIDTTITSFRYRGYENGKRCHFAVRRNKYHIEARDEETNQVIRIFYDPESKKLVSRDQLRYNKPYEYDIRVFN